MKKTLPTNVTLNNTSEAIGAFDETHDNVKLRDLMKEMSGVLKHAATDLLQPRKEAVKNLLKKALH